MTKTLHFHRVITDPDGGETIENDGLITCLCCYSSGVDNIAVVTLGKDSQITRY